MRDPELVARAGYAATRLEQAGKRRRMLHGLAGSSDLVAASRGTPAPLAAGLGGWAADGLPGQALQQLANWAAAESAPARTMDRTMDRSRTIR